MSIAGKNVFVKELYLTKLDKYDIILYCHNYVALYTMESEES